MSEAFRELGIEEDFNEIVVDASKLVRHPLWVLKAIEKGGKAVIKRQFSVPSAVTQHGRSAGNK
jgi:hypothetical protein